MSKKSRLTIIFFLVETIQCKQFRCIYLKNKKHFLNSFVHFWNRYIYRKNKKLFLRFFVHFSNLHQILNIFKKRLPSQLMYFRNYRPRKTWLDKCLKSLVCQVFSSQQRQFNANNSDAFIRKTKNFFSIFLCIFQIYIKF